jgi:hypothetical protein
LCGHLVDASRQKMENCRNCCKRPNVARRCESKRQTDALVALIQLEAEHPFAQHRHEQWTTDPGGLRLISRCIPEFYRGQRPPVKTNLGAVMAWTYSTTNAKGTWPPTWLRGELPEDAGDEHWHQRGSWTVCA